MTELHFLERKAKKVIGIGIGIPGYSDANRGIAISYSHLKDWKNIPVKDILEKEFHVTCYMDNNVNVMIFAYKCWYMEGNVRICFCFHTNGRQSDSNHK